MTGDDGDDLPITVDFRIPEVAAAWAADADVKRPWRADIRAQIAALVRDAGVTASADASADAGGRRVLELGPGPGLLAEAVLAAAPAIEHYALLDFASPMLEMCATRLARFPAATAVLADFRRDDWAAGLGVFDAVVTMQAVHEIRHKRHVPRLYREVHAILAPGGLVVICDHEPVDDRPLLSTEAEQRAALAAAGFHSIRTVLALHQMYVISATA